MDKVVIEGFELLEKLGEGGMGAVYKARQLSLDRMVAIKMLPRHVVQNADSVERFLVEARIAAALKHNNIIQVYEAGKSGEDYFFVMEWVTGYTVAAWIERSGPLDPKDALLVAESIADALAYAWDKSWVVHGDIKPANIMVDGDGTIKLADFLALTPPGGGERPESLREQVVGTPNYMSPEQARGLGTLDFHTDIYALGAVLYHLVTGHMPFEQENDPRETMRRQITDFIPDPQELNEAVSEECAWLIEKMMVKNPRHRYGSWQEVLEDIRTVRHGGAPAYPLPQAGGSTVSRSARRESSVISLPSERVIHRALDTLEHRDQLGARIRSFAYLTCFVLALVAAGAYGLHHAGLWPFEDAAEHHASSAQAETPAESTFPPALAPPPPPPEPVQIIPASAPPPVVEQTSESPVGELGEETEARILTPGELLFEPGQEQSFLDYARVFQRLMPLVRRRSHDAAEALLDSCIALAPEGVLRDQARVDRERLAEIRPLIARVTQNRHALKGTPVRAEPNIEGTLAGADGASITVACITAGGKEALVSVPMNRVTDASMRALIRAAHPENPEAAEARWLLSLLLLAEADAALQRTPDGPEKQHLASWHADWLRITANLRALEALERIRMELSQQRWAEAERLAVAAELQFGATEVFLQIKSQEWADVLAELDQARAEPEPVKPAPTLVFPEPAPIPPADDLDDEEPEDAGTLEELEVNEVKEGFVRLNGQVVRLRFRYRGDIRQVHTTQTYITELGSDFGRLVVIFPQEGLRWMKRIPRQENGRQRRTVYGTVNAADGRLDLIGRKKSKDPNAEPPFDW